MQIIEAILFEPVGCLAEFPPEEFNDIASRVFRREPSSNASGSQAYWDLLNLMETSTAPLTEQERALAETCELRAVERAHGYEDANPALLELKQLGVALIVASSLSSAAVARFLERFSLHECIEEAWTRDTAGGAGCAPLRQAVAHRALAVDRVLFLADTAGGLAAAKQAGVNGILMMNDPDEAMKLTAHDPAGGIVSLYELPDFVRLVAAEHARRTNVYRDT